MSHRSSPGAGASAASVTARICRLVSCPSCSYASSGRPGTAPSRAAPGARRHSTATMLSASPGACAHASALVTPDIASAAPPSCASTRSRLGPKPRARSSAATSAGVSAPALSTSSRRPWCSAAASRATGRPTSVITSTSSTGQPSRAQAYETDEGCGSTRTPAAPSSAVSARPIPWNSGSPLASTAIRRPACAASSPGTAGRNGDGHTTRSPVHEAGSSPSWRTAPTITSAARNASRAASVSPSHPSAPIPTTVTAGRGPGTGPGVGVDAGAMDGSLPRAGVGGCDQPLEPVRPAPYWPFTGRWTAALACSAPDTSQDPGPARPTPQSRGGRRRRELGCWW